MSGSSGNIYAPTPGGLANANTQYSNLNNQNVAAAGTVANVPSQVQGLTGQYTQNPYAPGAQGGANAASAYGLDRVTPAAQSAAGTLQGVGGANAGYVPQALAQGFDPQNALYNRGAQQTVDQQNAINSMSGVSNSPYGAGVTGQSLQNFNLGWDAQQIANQAQAAQTAAALTGAANAGFAGANQMGNAAVQGQTAFSALPSQTYEQNVLNELQGLQAGNQTTAGATGITDQAMSQLLSYLGYGTNAQSAQNQASNQTWSGIGQLLGTLGGAALGNPSIFSLG